MFPVVEFHPDSAEEIIKIGAEAEVCAGPLESLRLGAGCRVLVNGRLLTGRGMRSQTVDRELARYNNLRRLRSTSLASCNDARVHQHVRTPTYRGQKPVQAIAIREFVCIRNHASAKVTERSISLDNLALDNHGIKGDCQRIEERSDAPWKDSASAAQFRCR